MQLGSNQDLYKDCPLECIDKVMVRFIWKCDLALLMTIAHEQHERTGPASGIAYFASPMGEGWIQANEKGLVKIELPGTENKPSFSDDEYKNDSIYQTKIQGHLRKALTWVEHYFESKLTQREDIGRMGLILQGTPFQNKVWQAISEIPPGDTRTYQQIAHKIGRPNAARAVGAACGANPLPLVVPCHRVVASNGGLGGFAGGLELKQWLLDHEAQADAAPIR